MSRTIRWGIIGCGDVVERKSGPPLQEAPGSRVVSVMRRSAPRAKAYAERHDVPSWTTDAREVIRSDQVDAVYIATPPDHHVEYALAACEAGKPCLVEKPAGRSAEECRLMVDAFRAAGVPLYVSYYRRHLPKFLKVKEILDAGRLGPIVSIDYRLSKRVSEDNWRLSPSVCGGGRFYDLAGHVLDLFDDWFGPLEPLGGSALNAIARHEAEDVVTLSFRTPSGAVASALWNFASPRSADELVIEGLRGRLRLGAMECWSPVTLELNAVRPVNRREPGYKQKLRKLVNNFRPVVTEEFRFEKLAYPHRPLVELMVGELADGTADTSSGEAALRTAGMMDSALDSYYGGRHGAFWERPETWQSLRARARARNSIDSDAYRLTPDQVAFFEENGYVGPFRCDSEDFERVFVPRKDKMSLHLDDPAVFGVCSHQSVVQRVSQLMGDAPISLFKTRIHDKRSDGEDVIPWHQDAGPNNGGYREDGSPAETMTVWLALDDATPESGAVEVIPGTHRKLLGDYEKNIQAHLEDDSALKEVDMDSAVMLDLKAGEFYIFHSWLLHGSGPNTSESRRAGLNMRFARQWDDVEEQFEYVPVQTAEKQLEPLRGATSSGS